MDDLTTIRFGWTKIVTDEFAILEQYDPAQPADIDINIGFDVMVADKLVAVQVKCLFKQQARVYLALAVSNWFTIVPEDWKKMHDAGGKTVSLSLQPARHLASLSLSTFRGVLHAKTEGMSVNALVMPPINVGEMVKEKVSFVNKE